MERELAAKAIGAMPNGTRVKKVAHYRGRNPELWPTEIPIGTLGTITGSIQHPVKSSIGYFVRWDTYRHLEAFATELMIERENR